MQKLALAGAMTAAVCAFAAAASADSTPIGPLPKGPVTTVATAKGSLVAVALPKRPASTGLVWRLARPVDARVLREVSEADVGDSVVIVYRAFGTGRVNVVYALTRGDASAKALASNTTTVRVGAAR